MNLGSVAEFPPAETYDTWRSSASSRSQSASTGSLPIISATSAIERPSKRWW
jgi:hypothetical protein